MWKKYLLPISIIAIFSLAFFSLTKSCKSSSATLTRATGLAYEVVVTMDKATWDDTLGSVVKKDLESMILGLPQIEPSLNITYVPTESFDGLFTYVRNILQIKINSERYTKASFSYETDRFAKGQYYVTLKSPNEEMLVDYLKENPRLLSEFFVKVEKNRMIKLLQGTYSSIVMEHVKKTFNVLINAPADMTFYRDAEDFFWASNNANTGRTDLLIYSFPYTSVDNFTPEYLIAKRDSVLKINLPGSFPGSYMATETRIPVDYTAITQFGKYCGVLRGLYKVVGDQMGGPFVSHIRLDEKNQRVIVAEGFVYAPETNKRNYIRRVESALYTLRFPEEDASDLTGQLRTEKEK